MAGEFGLGSQDNLYIDLQLAKKSDQPIRRESRVPAVDELGDVRLFESEPRGGLHLSQPQFLNAIANLSGQLGFETQILGVRQTQIGKNIAAPSRMGIWFLRIFDFISRIFLAFAWRRDFLWLASIARERGPFPTWAS